MNERSVANVQVAVKPVFVQLLHSEAYEGPCRTGAEEDLKPEAERRKGEERFRNWTRQVEDGLSEDVRLLEPVKLEWGEDFHLPESELHKLEEDASQADLFLVAGGLSQYPAIAIGRRFGKPVAMVGAVVTVDVSAYLRSRGLEGYAPLDFDELNRLISQLRIRKAIGRTRILHALEGDVIPVGVVSTIYDMEDLKARFGVERHTLAADRLLEQMDALSAESAAEAEQLTEDLIESAEKSHMERDALLPSVRFYMAVKETMEQFECNAFTIPCFELCVRRIPARHKVTFCLAHTLLKDQGLPAACEGDVNVLMAMSVLMYTARKSSYMGNSWPVSKEENLMEVSHDVPGLKMNGFDTEDLPYTITPFTRAGWGGSIRHDFSQDVGQPVTMARFDPRARRLLVAGGEIVGGGGVDDIGCSLRARIKVDDVVELFHQEADFGHHLAVVYGDYLQDIQGLSGLMDFEVTAL